jgi:hypothetical protein
MAKSIVCSQEKPALAAARNNGLRSDLAQGIGLKCQDIVHAGLMVKNVLTFVNKVI